MDALECTNCLVLHHKYFQVPEIFDCNGYPYSVFYPRACCYFVLLCRAMGQGMERLDGEIRDSGEVMTVDD